MTSQLRDDAHAGDDGIAQPLAGSAEKFGAGPQAGQPRESSLLRQERGFYILHIFFCYYCFCL